MLKKIITILFAFIIYNILCIQYATAENNTYTQSFSNGSNSDGFTKYIPNQDTTYKKTENIEDKANPITDEQKEIPDVRVKSFKVKKIRRPMYYHPIQIQNPTGGMQIYTNPYSHGYNFGGEGPWVNTTPYYNTIPNYPIHPNTPPPSYKPGFPTQRPDHIHHRPMMPLNRNK